MAAVEQIKAKRAGIGLRALDRERAWPGFTLFAPQSGGGIVYLIDLEGNVVHTWRMPYAPGNYGYLPIKILDLLSPLANPMGTTSLSSLKSAGVL